MPHTEGRPWWADVQDFRDSIERRERAADGSRSRERRTTSSVPAERSRPPATGRRTIRITGQASGAPSHFRLVEVERRRPAPRAVERVAHRPDRIAMWAVVLGFLLIFVDAASTAHL